MRFYRFSTVLRAFAGVGGGLLLTALSGLYAFKPFVTDGEIIHFGFPFAWFEAGREGLFVIGPWIHRFVWHNFLADFVIYGLLVSAVTYLYFARSVWKTKSGA